MRRLLEGGVYYKLQLMGAAFIRGRRLLEEIRYLLRSENTHTRAIHYRV